LKFRKIFDILIYHHFVGMANTGRISRIAHGSSLGMVSIPEIL
jgi:hypothetical protein